MLRLNVETSMRNSLLASNTGYLVTGHPKLARECHILHISALYLVDSLVSIKKDPEDNFQSQQLVDSSGVVSISLDVLIHDALNCPSFEVCPG